MKYEYTHKNNTVTRGGEFWAGIRRVDPTTGNINIHGSERQLEYRIYGPFGQGYNLGIFSGSSELETLNYDWREGALIHPADPSLDFYLDRGTLTHGDKTIGNVLIGDELVKVDLREPVAPLDEGIVAVLMLLDVQWAKRVMLFERG